MNLILLSEPDFISDTRVRLHGRRLEHLLRVHRASPGEELVVGRMESLAKTERAAGPSIGRGRIAELNAEAVEMEVVFDQPAPAKLPLDLILALPRPKVLNRVIAGATSLGVRRIVLVNAWKVEKSYWSSPRMAEDNLLAQRVLGLEQARDTVLPEITLERLFRPFVEERLPALAAGTLALVAHPGARAVCPRAGTSAVCLAIGPEGGWIAEEVASFERAGFHPVSLGARILRVETAVAALIGRLF